MLLDDFAKGKEDIETCLNRHGYTMGVFAPYMNNLRKNILLLRTFDIINDDEAQKLFNRTVAKMAQYIHEIN